MQHAESKVILYLVALYVAPTMYKVATLSEPQIDRGLHEIFSESDNKDIIDRRRPRSAGNLVVLGIVRLLRSAKFLYPLEFGERAYVKRGGYKQAYEDFRSLNPTGVEKLEHISGGLQGHVGDRFVELWKKSPINDTPTMIIWKQDLTTADLIKYTD